MFKPNQKVVFVHLGTTNPGSIVPQYKEVITIKERVWLDEPCYHIVEYPVMVDGRQQVFPAHTLKPLSDIASEAAVEILEKIAKEIYQLP